MNELKHYKMYKAGKLWLTATITVLAFTGMATSVKADNQETAATAPQSVIASNSSASSAASVSAEPGSAVSSSTSQGNTATVASSAAPATNAQAAVSESANSSSPLKDQLDNNLLSEAERFHIFANNVQIGADVNGNIATRHYLSGNEFGTRNESHNYKLDGQTGDVYYIESFDQLGANAFRNPNSHVVFGNDAWGKIEIKDHHVFANGVRLDQLNPDKEKVENIKLIDFDQEFTNLRNLADLYAKQEQTEGVKVDFSDMNNRFIDISGVTQGAKTIFINVPLEYLSAPQPLTIKGLSSSEDGPVVILNVNMGSQTNVFLNTQTKLTYDDGQAINPSEGHSKPNHVIWNFGSAKAQLNVSGGYFLGSVLAPQSELNAGCNMDGNLIADRVNVTGGETHRWDLRGGTIIPHFPNNVYPVIPTAPTQPTSPSTPTQPTTPETPTSPTKPTTPVTPTSPTQPTKPETPTSPTQPTTPAKPTSPTQPTKPVMPTSPTQPTSPAKPTSPTQPTSPAKPTSPTQPTKPVTPTSPTQPTTPETPTDPTQPTTPVMPTSPTQPTKPETPTAPTQPTKSETPTTPQPTVPEIITPTVPMKTASVDGKQSTTLSVDGTAKTSVDASYQASVPSHDEQVGNQVTSLTTSLSVASSLATPKQTSQSGVGHREGQGLPQTGNSRSVLATVMGLIIGSLSLFGFRKRYF